MRQTFDVPATRTACTALPTQPPPASVTEALYRVSGRLSLPSGLLAQALEDLTHITDSGERGAHLAALMTGLMARGPVRDDVVEILQAALALDDTRDPFSTPPRSNPLIVMAGSGKKGLKTFNISTPSAIVAAAAGASIVKIGSRATSSAMGSRDLVGHLGLRESRTSDEALAEVGRSGFAFIPIEEVIPAVDELYGGRFHTINPFSFGLTALAAPLRGDVLVYGLAHPDVELAGRVLRDLGIDESVIVASGDSRGYYADELGVGSRTLTCRVQESQVGSVVEQDIRTLPGYNAAHYRAPTPPASRAEAAAWALDAISGGGPSTHSWLIAVNAALLLHCARIAPDLDEAYEMAQSLIASGVALAKLHELQEEASCQP